MELNCAWVRKIQQNKTKTISPNKVFVNLAYTVRVEQAALWLALICLEGLWAAPSKRGSPDSQAGRAVLCRVSGPIHTSHVFTDKVCKTKCSRLRAWRTKPFDTTTLVLMGLTRTKLLSALTLTARTVCTDLLSICVHPQHLVISCSNLISLSDNPCVCQYRTDSKQRHTEPQYLITHICFCLPWALALTKPLLHFSDGRAKHCLENSLWLCLN